MASSSSSSSNNSNHVQNLHILLVPLMTQSHLIPFTHVAKLIAQHGPTVTIPMTPLNAHRFADHDLGAVEILSLPFPCEEAGLPLGCESFDSLPSPDLVPSFFSASELFQRPLRKWVEEKSAERDWVRPSCVVSDYCLPWTEGFARELGIPRFVFRGTSCFSAVLNQKIVDSKILETLGADSSGSFKVPDIPDDIELTRAQLPANMSARTGEKSRDLMDKFKACEVSADGVVANTFEELERGYLDEFRRLRNDRVWCVGPVHPTSFGPHDSCSTKWLNERKLPGSVIYVCFGSLSHMSASQLKELALGLELSDRPFFWVVRKSPRRFEEWLAKEGFEERVKGRGFIARGWVPQARILGHVAVGGFLTHCGWNSVLEGLSAGRAMVTWPMFAEQFHNEKMVVQVLRIGVRVGVEEVAESKRREADDVDGDDDEEKTGFVGKEEIRRAVEDLMSEGGEADERRRRAREIGQVARRAVQEGGSSYSNVSLLLRYVSERLRTG